MTARSDEVLALCTSMLDRIMKMEMNPETVIHREAVNLAALEWVEEEKKTYTKALMELAHASYKTNTLKRFEFGNEPINEVDLGNIMMWACSIIVYELEFHPNYVIDSRRVEHFMQEVCEYLFDQYKLFPTVFKVRVSKTRESLRLLAERRGLKVA